MIWFQTFSGHVFDLEHPQAETVTLQDIAHALALQCRFNGHVRTFYSVAQHSVMVSKIVPHEAALQGLLHDAAETYTGDFVQPVKEWLRLQMADPHRLSDGIDVAILVRLGVPFPTPDQRACVKKADLVMLATEMRDLLAVPPRPWERLEDITPLPERITPWKWEEAEARFLERFAELRD